MTCPNEEVAGTSDGRCPILQCWQCVYYYLSKTVYVHVFAQSWRGHKENKLRCIEVTEKLPGRLRHSRHFRHCSGALDQFHLLSIVRKRSVKIKAQLSQLKTFQTTDNSEKYATCRLLLEHLILSTSALRGNISRLRFERCKPGRLRTSSVHQKFHFCSSCLQEAETLRFRPACHCGYFTIYFEHGACDQSIRTLFSKRNQLSDFSPEKLALADLTTFCMVTTLQK